MPSAQHSTHAIKSDVSQLLRVALERHRRGDDPFLVVDGLSVGIDGVLRQLFLQTIGDAQDRVAMVAVGGYGRREMCPRSDVDLLFLVGKSMPGGRIERLVRLLWDGGFQLGQSVRSPADCFKFMVDDPITAAAMLENRPIAGSDALYRRFLAQAVQRYRKRRGEAFARAKFEQLRESLFGDGRTIYVLEPHLKDGCACLRDIQRVLWIENMRRGLACFEDLGRDGMFPEDRVRALRAAYGFYLRTRCELHFHSGLKLDILERDSHLDVARALGYTGSPKSMVEQLMGDYYRHARRTYRFLRHYLETGTRGRQFFRKLAHKLVGGTEHPTLVRSGGFLFPRDATPPAKSFEGILRLFLHAHETGMRLSESLTERIRQAVEGGRMSLDRSPAVFEIFNRILREGPYVGRSLKAMHEAGVLTRVLPEFRGIEGLVSFDGHHHFTVDEHTLRTLEELDRIELGSESVPEGFHAVFRQIPDPLPLRLALLLHDVGKGIPGEPHAISGSQAAEIIGERLGIDDEERDTVRFLVYHHLRMFAVSESRDYTDPRVLDRFASLVRTPERLRMLYVMTYIDVASVGPGTWTGWKEVQLAELYERTMEELRLREGKEPRVGQTLAELVEGAELNPEKRRRVIEHASMFADGAYAREILPEHMGSHLDLVDALRKDGVVQVGGHDYGDYQEIIVCTRDRAQLFADLTGVLYAEGLNLLGARVFSRLDGIALDVFYVEAADGARVSIDRRVERIRDRLRQIDAKQIVVEDLIRQWTRSYRFRRMRGGGEDLYGCRVAFDNDSSGRYTVVDVTTRDRPGLLYDLASTIARLGLDLRSAKVSTLTDRAHDVFYVVEADGHKVVNPARMREIEQTLRIGAAGRESLLGGESPSGLPRA